MATSGKALRMWKAKNREADLRHKSDYRARQRRRRDLMREILAEELTTTTNPETT